MKKLIIIIVIIFGIKLNSQERVSLSVYQDAKFLFIGDEKRGYKAGTTDVIFRLNMQGNQQKHGYMIVAPQFEYAAIEGNYCRYSAALGYVLNKLIINNTELGSTASYGFISRYGITSRSIGLTTFVNYKLSNRFKIAILFQGVQRSDLQWLWGSKSFKLSTFIGIEINLN